MGCVRFKGKISTANSLSFQTSLCVLMLFAWAQNVSSDETPVRPQRAPHPPTRPYLLLLGEDGRSACHFRVDARSPDSSCGFIMRPRLCLFCISIVFFFLFFLARARYCFLLNVIEQESDIKFPFGYFQFFRLYCLSSKADYCHAHVQYNLWKSL